MECVCLAERLGGSGPRPRVQAIPELGKGNETVSGCVGMGSISRNNVVCGYEENIRRPSCLKFVSNTTRISKSSISKLSIKLLLIVIPFG